MSRVFIDTREQRELARLLRVTADALADLDGDLGRQTSELVPPPVELIVLRGRSAWARSRVHGLGADLRARSSELEREAWWLERIERGDPWRWAATNLRLISGIWPQWSVWNLPIGALALTWWLWRLIDPGGPDLSLDTGRSSRPGVGITRPGPVVPVKQGPFDFPNSRIVEAARAEFLEHQRTGRLMRSGGLDLPGECAVSVRRWVTAASGGSATPGGKDEVSAYGTATAIGSDIRLARPGDVVQYTPHPASGWEKAGLHTVVIAGSGDTPGTYHIYESNVQRTSRNGLQYTWVSEDRNWTPKPPSGWTAEIYRYGKVS